MGGVEKAEGVRARGGAHTNTPGRLSAGEA